jgi:hypothetical protein
MKRRMCGEVCACARAAAAALWQWPCTVYSYPSVSASQISALTAECKRLLAALEAADARLAEAAAQLGAADAERLALMERVEGAAVAADAAEAAAEEEGRAAQEVRVWEAV